MSTTGILARWGWLLAVGIALVGLALRQGDARRFWPNADEGIYYYIAHAPADQAEILIANNAHPPLYYPLLRALAPLGPSPQWLRLPALLAGVLAIVAIYALARRTAGEATGLLAALLLALSPGAVMLSQVARPYMLQILLLTLGLLFLSRYLEHRRARDLLPYVGAMAAALLLQYGSYLALGGIAIVLVGMTAGGRLEPRALRDLAFAHAPLAVLAVSAYFLHIRPRLLGGILQAVARGGWLEPYYAADPAAIWRAFLGLIEYLAGPQLFGIATLAFFAALAACLLRRHFLWVGLTAAVLGVAITLAAAELYPFGATRHTLYLAPFVVTLLASGMVALFSSGRGVAAATAAVLVLGAVAGERLGLALGALPDRRPPFAELRVTRAEMAEVTGHLEVLTGTPGLLLTDLATAFLLTPITREFGWQGGAFLHFAWGSREVLISRRWQMDPGRTDELPMLLENAPKLVPGLASALERDLRVVSYAVDPSQRPTLLVPVAPGRNPLAERRFETEHFSIFGLDYPAYRDLMRGATVEPAVPISGTRESR